jgi:hypothetical protein
MQENSKSVDAAVSITERIAEVDPVYRWVRKIRGGFFVRWLALSTVSTLWYLSLAAISGNLIGRKVGGVLVYGFASDVFNLYVYLVAMPVTIAGLVWLPAAIARVIHQFRRNQVVAGITERGRAHFRQEISFDIYVEKLEPWLVNRWLPKVVVLVIVIVEALVAYPYFRRVASDNTMHWSGTSPLVTFLFLIPYLFAYYSGTLLAVRAVTFAIWMARLFIYFRITVHPLYPDSCGGLGSFGSYIVGGGYLIGVVGLGRSLAVLISLGIWPADVWHPLDLSNPSSVIIQGITTLFVVVFGPAACLIPLWMGHHAMEQSKADRLARISKQYDENLARIQKLLETANSGTEDSLESGVASLKHLKDLADIVRHDPSWPVDSRGIVRFLSSSYIPFLISFIPRAFDYIRQVVTSYSS